MTNSIDERFKKLSKATPINKYKRPSKLQISLIRDDQGGMCGICRQLLSKESRYVVVDHCHETNRIRGLLCISCNTGLGMFKDKIWILKQAIDYLEHANPEHPSQQQRNNVGKYRIYC